MGFGNRETWDDANPNPRPALTNAIDFHTIFSKMDFVERIRDIKYAGDQNPRGMDRNELLLNSFYIRFSRRARGEGLRMNTPVGCTKSRKYYPECPEEKRSLEWKHPSKTGMLHLSLHDAHEDEDIWKHLHQLTGLEDIEAARSWIKSTGSLGTDFTIQEEELIKGAFVRWSERARQAGLLASTRLRKVNGDHSLVWTLSDGTALKL